MKRPFKGLRDRLSASAKTAWRFTLNHAGAMLGWEMSPDQLGDDRPDNAGPVEGLHLVGHWTRPGGGITPVIMSAVHAARAVAGRTRAPLVDAVARIEGSGGARRRRMAQQLP